jgi:transposase
MRAAKMFEEGTTQAEVVRRLGVSRTTASRWFAKWQRGGTDALRTEGRRGRKPRLTDGELRRVEQALLEGARAHGFGTDLWTLERVAEVIARQTGKRYHPGHVWRILKGMGWSLQRPARRAAERDQKAIGRWKKVQWPKIVRNARRRRAWICFVDESGVSLQPPVRRTWAPRGRTPTIVCPFNWKRASLVAATCYRPDGSGAELCFGLRHGAYNDEPLIEFLQELHRHLGGAKVTVVWDGLPSHRSKKMRRFIARQRRWLVVEQLPAYAPDLNPVEALWGNLKGRDLAHLLAETLADVIGAAKRGLRRIRRRPHLLFSFLRASGLSL